VVFMLHILTCAERFLLVFGCSGFEDCAAPLSSEFLIGAHTKKYVVNLGGQAGNRVGLDGLGYCFDEGLAVI